MSLCFRFYIYIWIQSNFALYTYVLYVCCILYESYDYCMSVLSFMYVCCMLCICCISIICISCICSVDVMCLLYCCVNVMCVCCVWYIYPVIYVCCFCCFHAIYVVYICVVPCVYMSYVVHSVSIVCAVGALSVYVWYCRKHKASCSLSKCSTSEQHPCSYFAVILDHFHIKKIKGRTISFFYRQVWKR